MRFIFTIWVKAMQPFNLTLKNYRCFVDEHPLRLEFRGESIAFIGVNNSGKSSALRMIYELRHVWDSLRVNLVSWVGNTSVYVGSGVVIDPDDIYTNLNSRDLQIVLEFPSGPDDGYPYLSKVAITFRRGHWGLGQGEIYYRNRDIEAAVPRIAPGVTVRGIAITEMGDIDISAYQQAMTALVSTIYIGAFRNAINEGAREYYDIQIGTGFVSMWKVWKVGSSKANTDRALHVTKAIQELFGFRSLEINAHASDKDLVVVVNGRSYLLNELGSGLSQFIVVMGNVAIRAPALILLDEPELNLHPSLQQKFLLELGEYASEGLIFATHSLGLARSSATSIYSFRLSDGKSLVTKFQNTPSFGELMGELSYQSYRELGYERVLLVEGVTDAPVFREFLRKLGADNQVVVIPLGGNQLARGDVQHELVELKRLSEKVYALVDSEKTSAEDAPCDERLAFRAACEAVGIPVLLTERRATDNYLSDRAIKVVFGPDQRAFGPFESRTDVKPKWKKERNWLVAAEMTREELLTTDIGTFLKQVVLG